MTRAEKNRGTNEESMGVLKESLSQKSGIRTSSDRGKGL